MSLEAESLLLQAGIRAGLLEPDKGNAALVVYKQLKEMGAVFPFGDFLVERGLITRMSLEGLLRNLQAGANQPVRTVSRLGDFELLELLGEGQSGSVFRARQVSLDRPVALKILSPALAADPEGLQRFLAEARVGARLRDPHIVQIFRVAVAEGLYYLAMELVDGGSARTLLEKSGGRLSEERALEIIGQIAQALDTAHTAGLLHRDVKPENILLTKEGVAKLADLGISLRMGPITENKGEFWGTPEYLAPEIIRGHTNNDPRSDLYSLGITLYEFLAGRPPFMGATPAETLRLHTRGVLRDVRELRPDISQPAAGLVMRLLAREAEYRFASAKEVVQAVALIDELRANQALNPVEEELEELEEIEEVRPPTTRVRTERLKRRLRGRSGTGQGKARPGMRKKPRDRR